MAASESQAIPAGQQVFALFPMRVCGQPFVKDRSIEWPAEYCRTPECGNLERQFIGLDRIAGGSRACAPVCPTQFGKPRNRSRSYRRCSMLICSAAAAPDPFESSSGDACQGFRFGPSIMGSWRSIARHHYARRWDDGKVLILGRHSCNQHD